jgi:4-hydroxy-4-methyl-2-oxoglutarate aldolase
LSRRENKLTVSVGFRVVTEIERPPESLLRRFDGLRSCDISDVMKRAGTMSGIRPVYSPIPGAVGPAVTVSVPAGGINMIKLGVQQTRPGDVLVVSAQAASDFALWGGNLTRGLQARGVRAFVIDGAIRDVTEIRACGFPIHARGVATAVSIVDAPWGEVNAPIACGGVVVRPGDIVVADEDGIVVVPPEEAAEIADGTRALMAHHESLQPTLLRGEVTSLDAITAGLVSAGVSFLDAPVVPSGGMA